MNVISKGDTKELVGQIIDVFEDFLESESDGNDQNNNDSVFICGESYKKLSEQLEGLLKNWKIIENV